MGGGVAGAMPTADRQRNWERGIASTSTHVVAATACMHSGKCRGLGWVVVVVCVWVGVRWGWGWGWGWVGRHPGIKEFPRVGSSQGWWAPQMGHGGCQTGRGTCNSVQRRRCNTTPAGPENRSGGGAAPTLHRFSILSMFSFPP